MKPNLLYLGLPTNNPLLKAICLGRYPFQFIDSNQISRAVDLDTISTQAILLMDACAFELKDLQLLILEYTEQEKIQAIIISASSTCLHKLKNLKLTYKVASMIDVKLFEPVAILNTLEKVVNHDVCFERILWHHPALNPSIKRHLERLPNLKLNELSELIQVSRSNNVSEFARKKNINRSTVHRRVSKTLQKLDMSALGEFKNYAIKNDLW